MFLSCPYQKVANGTYLKKRKTTKNLSYYLFVHFLEYYLNQKGAIMHRIITAVII
jgi:hypothetical protein